MKAALTLLCILATLWALHVELTHEAEIESVTHQLLETRAHCSDNCRRLWKPILERCRNPEELVTTN